MAEQKPRPFEATELDIISKAQAIACPDEDDGELHGAWLL